MSTINADDTDSHYVYSSGWTVQNAPQEYGGGTHCTSTDGASVKLNFRGKYIVIYATIPTATSPADTTRIDFDIDNGARAGTLSQRAFPAPIWGHPIYESSGLPETDHTLTLTFVNHPDTTPFCFDRVEISADIGSSYVPVLLDPTPALSPRELESVQIEKREVFPDLAPPVQTIEVKEFKPASLPPTYTAQDVQAAALAGGAVGGFAAACLMLLFIWIFKKSRKTSGDLKI
ncbi:hypothetical protein DFP72DRAFT_1045839 [Ephemerocybe angulata]|uniref:Uncharacterized protein n=1 Tax=Ephemerocybe angulata TaxID=980116 RepID=A0A8H6HWV7_9AGAR|nr:hypothetical protein DFP72DRAFT_1045839 [Tulosesus angulatus]